MDDAALLREIIESAPCSARKLAQAAGLSPGLLTMIQKGERSLTPETREKLGAALREWSRECAELAELVEPETGDSDG